MQQEEGTLDDGDEFQVKLRSRALGAGILVVGVALLAFNVFMLTSQESFYPKMLVVGCVAVPAGAFGSVFGWSPQFRGEPLWWQTGAWASSGVGLVAGLGAWYFLAQ